jgi:Purine nucleoside permease (NUP)
LPGCDRRPGNVRRRAAYNESLDAGDDAGSSVSYQPTLTLTLPFRVMAIRGAVNFDQGNPNETILQHLDPAPGQTAGGFAETVENIELVGSRVVVHIVAKWPEWEDGVPALPDQ